jgi:hypothetical protein
MASTIAATTNDAYLFMEKLPEVLPGTKAKTYRSLRRAHKLKATGTRCRAITPQS